MYLWIYETNILMCSPLNSELAIEFYIFIQGVIYKRALSLGDVEYTIMKGNSAYGVPMSINLNGSKTFPCRCIILNS